MRWVSSFKHPTLRGCVNPRVCLNAVEKNVCLFREQNPDIPVVQLVA
jgi:hypothetical protein